MTSLSRVTLASEHLASRKVALFRTEVAFAAVCLASIAVAMFLGFWVLAAAPVIAVVHRQMEKGREAVQAAELAVLEAGMSCIRPMDSTTGLPAIGGRDG